jgi:hypothetical protein
MKVFWSWQADTPGKTGRHFVRDALAEAIKTLRQPEEIEEPSEREVRQALHLDHDRHGVSGSPVLAATIFRKIEQSAVFVVDVTLVAEMGGKLAKKKLINSNVAIEYGYAVHALSDEYILMIQNEYYGTRDELPFDLKYKAGPIQYRLGPRATKPQIDAERVRLRGVLVTALRPYIGRSTSARSASQSFQETAPTVNAAFFWGAADVLARWENPAPGPFRRADGVTFEYRFNEHRAFYLRVIPTSPLTDPLRLTSLITIAESRRVDVLTRAAYTNSAGRNKFGVIVYEAHGDSTTPDAFTQLFQNGEIWGVTRDLFAEYQGDMVVPMVAVSNFYSRVLNNYILISSELGSGPPHTVEMGAVGLSEVRLSMPPPNPWNQVSGPIHQDEFRIRRVLNDVAADNQSQLIDEFQHNLYDLVGISV